MLQAQFCFSIIIEPNFLFSTSLLLYFSTSPALRKQQSEHSSVVCHQVCLLPPSASLPPYLLELCQTLHAFLIIEINFKIVFFSKYYSFACGHRHGNKDKSEDLMYQILCCKNILARIRSDDSSAQLLK